MDQQNVAQKVWGIAKKVLIALIIAAIVLIVLLIVVVAYLKSSSTKQTSQPNYYGDAGFGLAETSVGIAPAMPPFAYDTAQKLAAREITTAAPSTTGNIQPKVIKTASLDITVNDVDKSVNQITNEAVLAAGFVQNSSVTENQQGRKYASIILRVPVSSFESIISKIKSLAKLANREDINGQEVTQEYVDLQANLTHDQAVEAQYLELLKRAQKVEEIIAVRDKLDQVQGEIEMLKGRLRYLDNQTEMATIAVSISSETKVTLPANKWQPWEIVKEAAKNLIVGIQNFVNFIIFLFFSIIGLIPYLLIIFLLYLLAKWLYKKYSRPKKNS